MQQPDVDTLLQAHAELPRGRARARLLLLCAPLLLLFAVECAQRLFTTAERPLPAPWQTKHPLHVPMSDVEEHTPGDLVLMAGLPAFARRFDEPQRITSIADANGFRAVLPIDGEPADVWVAGASFFDSGSSNDATFAGALEHALGDGHRVQNRALQGDSAASVLRAITSPDFERAPPKVLVWGAVQRLLDPRHFRNIVERLGTDGAPVYAEGATSSRDRFVRYRDWHRSLEAWLRATSIARERAAALSPWLPPMAIDLGRKSPVILADIHTADGDAPTPMLFFADAVASANRPLAARKPQLLLDAIERVRARCRACGTTLVLVSVPDKYELYRDRATFVSRPDAQRTATDERAATALLRELDQRGFDTIDLFPVLRDAQRRAPAQLLYHRADTHWNDAGIRLAATHVSEHVRGLLAR